jgi:amino acid permease
MPSHALESIKKSQSPRSLEENAAVAIVESKDDESLAVKRPVNVARGLSSRHIQLFAIAGVIGGFESCPSIDRKADGFSR